MESFLFPLLLAFALFLGLFSVNCNALSQCLQADSSALLQLKRGFTTSSLSTWLPGTDCCTWVGVTCDESRRVIGLELGYRSIAGKIDPSLFNLTSLRNLSFSFNQFGGISIPDSGWDRLVNLSMLDLSMARFVGEVPAGISRLSKLISLDLSWNNGLYLTINPTFLQNMSSLRILKLSGVNLSAYGDKWFDALQNFTPILEMLNMHNCSLLGFPEQIFQMKILKSLDISENSMLSGSLPDFSKESSLESLILSNTNFSRNLPDAISNLKFLTTLDISNCQFSGRIPSTMRNLSSLENLNLSYNNFSGDVELEFIKDLNNLEVLDLSNSGFSLSSWDADDGFFSSFFSNMSYLRLAGCNLSKIPSSIKDHWMLELDLSNNKIHGEIPSWVWSNGRINLSCNFFTHIVEPSTYQLPGFVDLHSNKLGGPIPPLPLDRITFVDLSNNQFSSFIPSNFSDISANLFFSLANNNLTGEIPLSICNLTYLLKLDLSNNMLTGSIPPCLFEKANHLEMLNLNGNQLKGVIPQEFSPECKLQTVNLRDNQLEGLLPRSISNCRSLMILDIGNNNLEDIFPYWLGNMTFLRVLVLRSNKFHGLIEFIEGYNETNSTFLMLRVLDISSNNFSGKLCENNFSNFKSMMVNRSNTIEDLVYDGIGHSNDFEFLSIMNKGQLMTIYKIWMYVNSIDISDNYFEGEIPRAIGQLISLKVLNMSHNYLTGEIPPQMGRLSQLESLDLSMNTLSGNIPQELVSLNFLSYLNLSYNKLVGNIPKGGQFSTFPNSSFEGNEGLCCWFPDNNTVLSPPSCMKHLQKAKVTRFCWECYLVWGLECVWQLLWCLMSSIVTKSS